MTNEALEARRAYKRNWAKNNPDKVKAQQARYWQRKAQKGQTTDGQTKQEKGAAT